jgi:hypothetical protein
MADVVSNSDLERLFTQGCHHRNLTTIFLGQNLYAKGKSAKTISLNTHILILFKSMRGGGQIAHLSREIYPGNPKALLDAYINATSMPYGYILVDLSPHTISDQYRLRTRVFPDEAPLVVYIPRV